MNECKFCPYSKLMQAGTEHIGDVLNAINAEIISQEGGSVLDLLLKQDNYCHMAIPFIINCSDLRYNKATCCFEFSGSKVCNNYKNGICAASNKNVYNWCKQAKIEGFYQNYL